MKNYIRIHHERSKLGERVFWWILRALMIYAIIDCLLNYIFYDQNLTFSLINYFSPVRMERGAYLTQVAQSSANLFGMFAWEIMVATKEKSFLHYIPSYVQNITLLGFFLGSFGGAYVNLYYSFPAYDIILHVFGGAEACFVGYEIITAIQLRDKKTAPIGLILLGACGISFMLGVGWELFEFTYDQVAGGDSQHWSYQLALDAFNQYGAKIPNVIPELDPSRYALMDTMEDTVANVLGAVGMYLALKVRPYHHCGKNDVNRLIEEELRASEENN